MPGSFTPQNVNLKALFVYGFVEGLSTSGLKFQSVGVLVKNLNSSIIDLYILYILLF
jgi:hypothetical protein